MTWHSFTAADDDLECRGCGVVVIDSAEDAFTLPCPAPPCEHPSNAGQGCVFVPGPRGPECSYCDQLGVREPQDEDPDVPEDRTDA